MSMSHDYAVSEHHRETSRTVAQEWQRCRPWIVDALEYDGGFSNIEDIEAAIRDGKAHFWPGRHAAVITQFWDFPQCKALNVWLAGGDMDELLDDMFPAVEQWANINQCSRMIIAGRKGWERAMKPLGFGFLWSALSKELGG